jgi:hypothetical protein
MAKAEFQEETIYRKLDIELPSGNKLQISATEGAKKHPSDQYMELFALVNVHDRLVETLRECARALQAGSPEWTKAREILRKMGIDQP